jgi:hypothetical protein
MQQCVACPAADAHPARAPQTYGMLIYRLLGDEAQQSFARSWGISYGVGAAQEVRLRCAVGSRRVRRR